MSDAQSFNVSHIGKLTQIPCAWIELAVTVLFKL